ncbi:hypothetical protein K435DRAFT_872941 [Dendrothele bispora CBS 962.96]|uniref:Uncharacterized protein n=1 Tax=Dendrothele bispora (strain CBS 962.96) TaxID=1314807 RepID=A0A4S8L0C0_DENBC|nr:hypothetical protein K435DRAFT_872941 [Dendrothele bispora CBS 962.96]
MPPPPNLQPNNLGFADHLRNGIVLMENLERFVLAGRALWMTIKRLWNAYDGTARVLNIWRYIRGRND